MRYHSASESLQNPLFSVCACVVTSITWVPSSHVDVIENARYKPLNNGVLVWESPIIARISASGQTVPPPYRTCVPNVASDTLVLTETDIELTGHKIVVNDNITLGEVEVYGDKITFTQSFAIPQP